MVREKNSILVMCMEKKLVRKTTAMFGNYALKNWIGFFGWRTTYSTVL
jgi:hypothetical protein